MMVREPIHSLVFAYSHFFISTYLNKDTEVKIKFRIEYCFLVKSTILSIEKSFN